MHQAFEDVLRFHKAMFPELIGTTPKVPGDEVVNLRWDLVCEEFSELREATQACDLPKIADGIADLIYVLIGMAISYGIDLRPVWDEVQMANLRKIGGPRRADGKALKPPGWRPPDIAMVLESQASIGGVEVQHGEAC